MINKKLLGVISLALILMIGAMPAFAADTDTKSQQVQVTVGDTVAIKVYWNGAENGIIRLGTLAADDATTTFTGNETIRTYSNVDIDVWTRLAGNFLNGTNDIAMSNFMFGNATPSTPYTNTYQQLFDNWNKAPKNPGYDTKDVNFSLKVPFGTDPGNYNTTVYFTAVKWNQGQPE